MNVHWNVHTCTCSDCTRILLNLISRTRRTAATRSGFYFFPGTFYHTVIKRAFSGLRAAFSGAVLLPVLLSMAALSYHAHRTRVKGAYRRLLHLLEYYCICLHLVPIRPVFRLITIFAVTLRSKIKTLLLLCCQSNHSALLNRCLLRQTQPLLCRLCRSLRLHCVLCRDCSALRFRCVLR